MPKVLYLADRRAASMIIKFVHTSSENGVRSGFGQSQI